MINNNNALEEYPSEVKSQVILPETAETLKEMMTMTVTSGTGTGTASNYTDVAGKTGTSEDAECGLPAFRPLRNRARVISVYVADGSEGSAAAVAVFREIIDGLAVLEGEYLSADTSTINNNPHMIYQYCQKEWYRHCRILFGLSS